MFIRNALHSWVKEIIICVFKNQLKSLKKSRLEHFFVHLVHILCTISVDTLYIVPNIIGLGTRCEHRHVFIFIVKKKKKTN